MDDKKTDASQPHFKIVKEDLCYSRYLNVYNRVVEYPSKEEEEKGQVVDYDIVGSKTVNFHYCAVLPFNSSTKTVTLLKEYAQGANSLMYNVPCGGLSKKHVSLEDCARNELSEEVTASNRITDLVLDFLEQAHLCNGKWIQLLEGDHPGLLEVKWSRNRFTPFLVIDPEIDPNPGAKDTEEFIEILKVDIKDLGQIMYGGEMMLPSIVTCAMGLNYLEKHHYI